MRHEAPVALCIDASLFLRVLLPDERTPEVDALWDSLKSARTAITAPHLFVWECVNGIRQAVRQARVNLDTAEHVLTELATAPISLGSVEEKVLEAWREFIVPFDLPAAYDAAYLALADDMGCELWTSDRRLYRAVGHALPWVKAVGLEG